MECPFTAELVVSKQYEDDKGKFHVVGYAATKDHDLQGDVIAPEAMEHSKKDLMKNSTVLLNHDDFLPIGRVTKQTLNKKGIIVDVLVDKDATIPNTGTKVIDAIKQGILNKFSIRAKVLDAAREFVAAIGRTANVIKRMLLLEVSLVSVPANPEAAALEWYVSKALGTSSEGTEDMDAKKDTKKALTHNSTLAENAPDWGDVDKTQLPANAFVEDAPGVDPALKSTWTFPHHWVKDGGGLNDEGVFTEGDMFLHRGGLNAAWAAAMGARSDEPAASEVITHLEEHRKALGIEEDETEADAPDGEDTKKDATEDKPAEDDTKKSLDGDDDAKPDGDAPAGDSTEPEDKPADGGEGEGGDEVQKDVDGEAPDAETKTDTDAPEGDEKKSRRKGFPHPETLNGMWRQRCTDKGLTMATDQREVVKEWFDFCKDEGMPAPFPFPYPVEELPIVTRIAEIAEDLLKNEDENISGLGTALKDIAMSLMADLLPVPDVNAAKRLQDAADQTQKDEDGGEQPDGDGTEKPDGDGDAPDGDKPDGEDKPDGDTVEKKSDPAPVTRKGVVDDGVRLKAHDILEKQMADMTPDERLRHLLKQQQALGQSD